MFAFHALLMVAAEADMHALVRERLLDFNRFRVDVQHDLYRVARDASIFDRSAWRDPGIVGAVTAYSHRVTVARPNLMDEWLTDAPQAGYEPVTFSASPAGYCSRQVVRGGEDAGKTLFVVFPDSVQTGHFAWAPMLQLFDVHLQDSRTPFLNVGALFDAGLVTHIGQSGDLSSFEATVPWNDLVARYEFDLSPAGTVVYWKTTLTALAPAGLQPMTWEQHALALDTLDGVEFASEAIVVVDNPNAHPDRTLHHYRLSNLAFDPLLTPSDAQVVATTRDSVVTTHFSNGTARHCKYDSAGSRVLEQEFQNVSTPDEALAAQARRRDGAGPLVAPLVLLATFACSLVAWKLGALRVRGSARRARS